MLQTLQKAQSQRRQQHEDGFSLLELVVAVSIMLILAVAGTIGYQTLTNNAREAAVEQAANDMFTAAMASHLLGEYEELDDIELEYNRNSGIDISGSIDYTEDDLTVRTAGWDNEFRAIRSTETELEEQADKPTDIDEYDGTFIFTTTTNNSEIYLDGLSADAELVSSSGIGGNLLNHGGTVDLPFRGTYIFTGGFETIGKSGVSPQLASIDVWEDTGTVDASYAFRYNKTNMTVADLPSTVENIDNMFSGSKLFNQDISHWDVSNVKSMDGTFLNAHAFNNGGAPLDWGEQTGNVTDMRGMFTGARSFNQPIGDWDVSNVTNMQAMFDRAEEFNQDITTWDVSNVRNMHRMFSTAKAFDQDITQWDISSVTAYSEFYFGSGLQEEHIPPKFIDNEYSDPEDN